jgi:hypothetical protein
MTGTLRPYKEANEVTYHRFPASETKHAAIEYNGRSISAQYSAPVHSQLVVIRQEHLESGLTNNELRKLRFGVLFGLELRS